MLVTLAISSSPIAHGIWAGRGCAELRLLVENAMGQWSDGIGENWTCCGPEKCGYSIMCLTVGDGAGPDYPAVEVLPE
jgi:hypothetical protein